MRVSTFKDDPGHANEARLRGCLVLLNFAEVRCCLTADEEQGLVVVARLADGRMYVDRATGKVATETLFGVVQIIPPAVQMSACIDANAEMIQKDAVGNLEQTRRDWERAGRFIEGMRKALADMQPPEPGESLGIVAPMDHRLGRFRC